MQPSCNGCGKCCDELDDLRIELEDIICWYFDTERDNEDILQKIVVDFTDKEEDKSYESKALYFCQNKFDFGYDLELFEVTMRRYRGHFSNAFDGTGKCWFYNSKKKICKIHDVKPRRCREWYCKSGNGTDERLLISPHPHYSQIDYPHKITEKGFQLLREELRKYGKDLI